MTDTAAPPFCCWFPESKDLASSLLQGMLEAEGCCCCRGEVPKCSAEGKLLIHVIYDASLGKQPVDLELLQPLATAVKDPSKCPIPLVVAVNPKRWQEHGLEMPSEFICDAGDLRAIRERVNQLAAAYSQGDGFLIRALQDSLVGHWRYRLGMDQENHDTGSDFASELVRLKDALAIASGDKITELKGWHKPKEGKVVTLPGKIQKEAAHPVWKSIFPEWSERLAEAAGALSTALAEGATNDVKEKLLVLEAAVPRWQGQGLLTHFPSKPKFLVVDDEANSVIDRLKRLKTIRDEHDGAVVKDIADFVPAFTDRHDDYLGALEEFLGSQAQQGTLRQFDAILLDLSFGDEKKDGERFEPTGWRLLGLLKKWFPDIPLIVHSSYGDATQVRLAYNRGASWFLRKDESHKLLSRLRSITKESLWRKEWQSVQPELGWYVSPGAHLDDAERYLIWKTVENMPGGRIRVRELRGGIGGAQTLEVSREIDGIYDRAAPVVIKIDDKFPMLLERERYLRFIQPYLSNMAGRIDVPLHVGGNNLGAIAYTYAGGSQGRRGERREVVTLEQLLRLNLHRKHQAILSASLYDGLFDTLLDEVLPRIHSIRPERSDSEGDFPNQVFGEGSAVEGLLCRMPPECEVDVRKPLGGHEESGMQKLLVYNVNRPDGSGEKGRLQCLMPREDGLLHRIDVLGLLGPFYAEHRKFRPMQPVWLEMTDFTMDGECFKRHWKSLWTAPTGTKSLFGEITTKSEGSPQASGLEGFTTCNDVADALVDLVNQLTSGGENSPRKALEMSPNGIIHGDLNLGNVMVERERGKGPVPFNSAPWLIDFARTCRGPIVYDFTQLEMNLCLGLVRSDFFTSEGESSTNWSAADSFVSHFLETPWQEPPSVREDPRLEFLFYLMCRVRDSATVAGVDTEAYMAARVWQCLISHKILCNKWKKNPGDTTLQFRCIWSLKQAFMGAKLLGWEPSSKTVAQ